ncbi:hypothetical protein FJD35_32420 [Pseudomonas mandelii]|nr:hypothetical protein FHN83_27495 [Leclercia adecarboxylata]RAY65409.1 hypothetical protein DP199_25015 [Enterobacter kobei]TWS02334.1 hypothetical protein FJD35_32420 [Pseudomonas mandelii]
MASSYAAVRGIHNAQLTSTVRGVGRFLYARVLTDRVGGGFTSAVLSHHRTYGSVYGGSSYAVKPVYRIQYRD